MSNLINETQDEIVKLTGRVLAAARRLPEQPLDDLKHAAETMKREDPSPSRRVAAYIVADCCGEVQRESHCVTATIKPKP